MKTGAILCLSFLITTPLMSSAAYAQDKDDAPELRERVTCFPSKNFSKFVSKFQNLDADKRDVVDMVFDAKFDVNDGGVLPERIFIRDNGAEQNFTLTPDGTVPDFIKIADASETAELCSEDPSRVGTPRGGDDMKFSLESDVQYLKNTGYHDLATLKDGLKDGKSHFKKMVPAPMRLIVPKMSHVMINYEADDAVAAFSAMKGNTSIEGLTSDQHCEQTIIKVKDLEDLGAEGLQVSGGPYILMPVPNKKMLKKFVQSSGQDESEKE